MEGDKKQSVLHFIRDFEDSAQARDILSLAETQKQRGYHVGLVTAGGGLVPNVMKRQIPVFTTSRPFSRLFPAALLSGTLTSEAWMPGWMPGAALLHWIRSGQFNRFHSHDYSSLPIVNRLMKKGLGVAVATLYDLPGTRRSRRRRQLETLASPAVLVSKDPQSSFYLAQLRTQAHLVEVPHGVRDVDYAEAQVSQFRKIKFLDKIGLAMESILLLFAGPVPGNHCLEPILKGLRSFDEALCCLFIARGPVPQEDRKRLVAAARKTKMLERLQILENWGDMPAAYAMANGLVMAETGAVPLRREILEAHLMGVPSFVPRPPGHVSGNVKKGTARAPKQETRLARWPNRRHGHPRGPRCLGGRLRAFFESV